MTATAIWRKSDRMVDSQVKTSRWQAWLKKAARRQRAELMAS